MGRSKQRKRKLAKSSTLKMRIRWNWMTFLVYAPLTLLAFGIVLGATLIHVLNHPDISHVTAFGSFVLLAVYLFYYAWKTR